MGFRFNRRISILRGLRINFGRRGMTGVSVGRKGVSASIGKRGIRANIATGVPGLSYSARGKGAPGAPVGKKMGEALRVIVLAIAIALFVILLRLL
jgi:hypothetical protein